MLTISSTTLTLEASSEPCTSVPAPFWPGTSTWGAPLAGVSRSRFWPSDCRPLGLTKRAICTWPSTWLPPPANSTDTVPSRPMVRLEAFWGTVMAGCSKAPLEVTSWPAADSLKPPSRV